MNFILLLILSVKILKYIFHTEERSFISVDHLHPLPYSLLIMLHTAILLAYAGILGIYTK